MKNQRKRRKLMKRLISGVSALVLSVGLLASIPASADDSTAGYKYTLFAYSSEEGAISSSAANFCVNGNISTNGTISAGQNFNVNGEKKEHANEAMPDLTKNINEKFFAENVDVKAENYKNEDVNINMESPLDVKGKAEFKGNIKLASGVKAMGDIVLSGGVLNNDNTVLFSENGSININSENVSLTGLIYAPKGNIVIESKSLNLNSVVMIANKITLNAPNININNSASMAKFVQEAIDKNGNNNTGDEPEPEPVTDPAIYAYGEYNEETKSVDIEWYSNVTGEFAVLESMNGTDYTVVSKVFDNTKYSIKVTSDFIKKYFKVATIKDGKTIESIPFTIVNANGKYTTELLDTDKDGLADLYEEMLGTDKTVPDTDKDGLTDYEEVYITNTDPTKYDSVTDGVSDANADNDKDGLTNKREIELKTDPNSDDTDGDTLKDGDELSKYNTDPIKRDTDGDELEDDDELKFNFDPNKQDTDGNGIIDSKEKNQQSLEVVPDNKEQAVTKVSVSMSATGNIEKTTTVESIMNKDVLCSNVVGLVGEPFSIESESSFDKATITFTVDKTKLGETEFDNLMFLWYDRENDNFVELETSHDAANSTVSVETTHFSEYMIVDSKQWFDNWEQIESDRKRMEQSGTGSSIVHVIQPTATVVFSHCSDETDPKFLNQDLYSTTIYHQTNYRTLICEHLIDSMSVLDAMDIVRTKIDIFHQSVPKYYHTAFSNDKDYLKQELEYYLEGSYFNDDITNEIRKAGASLYTDELAKDKKVKRIVFITDRDYYVSTDELIDYSNNQLWAGKTMDYYNIYKSIPIYFAYIGDIDDNKFEKLNLHKIAAETGGKVYKVATLNELYSELGEKNHVSNVQDYDKDGFSDMEETYGLIVDSSGTRYKTKLDKDDSDDDGLKDNEEVDVNRIYRLAVDKNGKEVWKSFHTMRSIPTEQDSDKDGLDDKLDNAPLNPKVHAFVIYETIANDSDLKVWSSNDKEYPEDFKYADKTKEELKNMDWINWTDFCLVDEKDYKYSWVDLAELTSMGDMEDVAKDMINHFISGLGSDYRNDVLTKNVDKHENTQAYVAVVRDCFEALIKEQNGELEALKYDKERYIDESDMKEERILTKNTNAQAKRRKESLMVTKLNGIIDEFSPLENDGGVLGRISIHNPAKPPVYDDKLSGLGFCVDSLYGNRIEVSSYEFDGRKYKYTLHFVMYDIFGLDDKDIEQRRIAFMPFGVLAGFRSWYILQHYNKYDGKYKPFVSYMEFDRTFEGEIK